MALKHCMIPEISRGVTPRFSLAGEASTASFPASAVSFPWIRTVRIEGKTTFPESPMIFPKEWRAGPAVPAAFPGISAVYPSSPVIFPSIRNTPPLGKVVFPVGKAARDAG